MKKVGKITHYFSKIGVAIVQLEDELSVGQSIKISGHDKEFTQEVKSIQSEHQQVEKATKGQSVGLKIDQEVKEGDEVYLV